MAQTNAAPALKRTPLYDLHVRLGARMVPFAGYDMPVQYPGGIIKEHLHTRAAAGLFDVSHMGQIALRPRSGRVEDAARALETLVPGDMLGLAAGRQRYTLFTNAAGRRARRPHGVATRATISCWWSMQRARRRTKRICERI